MGDEERLARILENPGYDIEIKPLSHRATASILEIEKTLNNRKIVDDIVGHRGNDMSLILRERE